MQQGVQIEFGTIGGETIFLAIALIFLIFLLVIRQMMKIAMREQIQNFDDFKQDVSKDLGGIKTELKKLHEQSEASSRAKERRIENIEHSLVTKEEFFRDNTLIKSMYDDLNRYIQHFSAQLENLKILIIQKNEPK